MCQVIVTLRDLSSAPGAYRAGEVVVIVEDDHVFSALELSHPRWRVLRIPGLPSSALRELTLSDASPNSGYRRAHCASSLTLSLLHLATGPITLTPEQAMEVLTTFTVRHAD